MSQEVIMDITLVGIHYKMIDTLYFGEVSSIRKNGKHLIGLSDRIKALVALPPEQYTVAITDISNEMLNKSDDSDEVVKDALMRCYGLSLDDVKKLHYMDAGYLFSELLRESTVPKKKLEKHSILSSSSELPTTPQ